MRRKCCSASLDTVLMGKRFIKDFLALLITPHLCFLLLTEVKGLQGRLNSQLRDVTFPRMCQNTQINRFLFLIGNSGRRVACDSPEIRENSFVL